MSAVLNDKQASRVSQLRQENPGQAGNTNGGKFLTFFLAGEEYGIVSQRSNR